MADFKVSETLKKQIDDHLHKLESTVRVLFVQLELAHDEIKWMHNEDCKQGREMERLLGERKFLLQRIENLESNA